MLIFSQDFARSRVAIRRVRRSVVACACSVPLTVAACGTSESSQSKDGGTTLDVSVDESGGTDALPDATPDSGCVPRSCMDLGAGCGRALDGCGGVLECGVCPNGQTCGAAGPNLCGEGTCIAKSCVELAASCGLVSDGCADVLDCGLCPVPKVCGGSGQPNLCGCIPRSCAELGASCGTLPDGCDGVAECGSCPVGKTCGGGGPNLCGEGTCTPRTCAQVGATCGWASDGCAAALDCGTCELPDVCGGSGLLNTCGCLPKTCAQIGATCGQAFDGCGSALSCGTCPAPLACGAGGIPNRCADPGSTDGGSPATDCDEPGAILDANTGHCYFLSAMLEGTWDEQKHACESADAHLVVITSESEANVIVPLLTNAGRWIGLERDGDASDFTWVTDEPFTYQQWKQGEPNGFGDSCVLTRTKEGVWLDEPCDLLHAAICERP